MAPKPRKRKDTLIGTIREKHPGFAEGIIRADAKFETLKRKLGLPELCNSCSFFYILATAKQG